MSNPFWVLYICTAVDIFTMSLMMPVMNEIRKDLTLRPALWGAIGKNLIIVISLLRYRQNVLTHSFN
jgi:hypothetical protein